MSARGFAVLIRRIWGFLPRWAQRWIAPTFIGFAIINGFAFCVDMVVLTALYKGLGWPNPVAVSVGYAVAFTISFTLNKVFNFEVHGPIGRQIGKYLIVMAINYTALILGVGSGLHALGLPFWVSRTLAAMSEGLFVYCMMRWWVFRDAHHDDAATEPSVGQPTTGH